MEYIQDGLYHHQKMISNKWSYKMFIEWIVWGIIGAIVGAAIVYTVVELTLSVLEELLKKAVESIKDEEKISYTDVMQGVVDSIDLDDEKAIIHLEKNYKKIDKKVEVNFSSIRGIREGMRISI